MGGKRKCQGLAAIIMPGTSEDWKRLCGWSSEGKNGKGWSSSPAPPTDPGPKFSPGALYPSGVSREREPVGHIDKSIDPDLRRDLFQDLGLCNCGAGKSKICRAIPQKESAQVRAEAAVLG